MLIALFGASSAGKTTIARALASTTHLEARYCGDVVRAAAREAQVALDALPLATHERIDADTVAWCASRDDAIVEGRFLDQVLTKLSSPICLIQIVASDQARAERWTSRLDRSHTLDDISGYDRDDEAFRVRTYSQQARLTPRFSLDTSTADLHGCLERISTWLRDLKLD